MFMGPISLIFMIGLFVPVYWLGSMLASFLRNLSQKVQIEGGFGFDRNRVDLIMRGILVLAAVIAMVSTGMIEDGLLGSILPGAEFDEIAAMFAERQDRWVVTVALNVLFMQFIFSLATFIPFLLFNYVIRFVKWILCGKSALVERKPVIALLLELVTIMAIGILSSCMFDFSVQSTMDFMDLISVENLFDRGGWLRFLLLVPVFVLVVYLVIRDLFSSDILLAIIAVNTLAAFLRVEITAAVRVFLIACAIGCGLLSGFVRGRMMKNVLGDDLDTDIHAVYYGIGSAVAVFFLVWMLWAVVGKLFV